jgi:hypothetical protein
VKFQLHMLDSYVCYYCQKTYEDYPDLIKHLSFKHANDIVKYRERELDSAGGRLGYRTKYFQDIIPSKCEIIVTHDNRLSISNFDRSCIWSLENMVTEHFFTEPLITVNAFCSSNVNC